ncbi:acetyl-CoA carboxylase [Trujillonella humicola]|uniref:acetyl-CoA carboxylase n=1 Tax=Trujillonella humicola TaxID=3383699 RepID=UPI003905D116
MNEHVVQSPLPGVFYRRPSPDNPPFVEEGGAVSAGQTIGLVEIMKQFAEVKSEVDGTLRRFEVTDNGTVDPGDPIATIEVT